MIRKWEEIGADLQAAFESMEMQQDMIKQLQEQLEQNKQRIFEALNDCIIVKEDKKYTVSITQSARKEIDKEKLNAFLNTYDTNIAEFEKTKMVSMKKITESKL